jgi:hypothetical protein
MSCTDRRRPKTDCRTLHIACVALAALGIADRVRAVDFTIGTSFSGSSEIIGNSLGSNSIPAMPMGAVGPSQLVEFTSSTFATYSKTGTLLQRVGHRQFWQQALTASGANTPIDFPGSTRVLYDRYSNRFYAVAVDNRSTTSNNLLIAVTTGSDASLGNWRAFSQDVNSSLNTDSILVPEIGLNRDALFIGGNLYPADFSTAQYSMFGVPLSSLLASVPSIQGIRIEERVDPDSTGLLFQPAVDLDGESGALPGAAFFNSDYRKRTTIPAGWLAGTEDIPVQDFPADFAPLTVTGANPYSLQPGGVDVFTGGNNFTGNVVKQNGKLWAAHEVDVGGRNGIRWYEFGDSGGQFTIEQTGVISDPTLAYYEPSIAVNEFGDVVIGFSGSSSNTPISAFLAVGRTQDGATTFGSPVMSQLGSGTYAQFFNEETFVRWGQYSATVVDPIDPRSFWTFQAYVENTQFGGLWANRITQVRVVPEPNAVVLGVMAGFFLIVRRRSMPCIGL